MADISQIKLPDGTTYDISDVYFVQVGSDEDYASAWAAAISGKLIVGISDTGQGYQQITNVEMVNKSSVKKLIFTAVVQDSTTRYSWNCITGEWSSPKYTYLVSEDNIVNYLPIYDGTVTTP